MISGLDTIELLERLKKAEANLLAVADKKGTTHAEVVRLLGKRSGVAMARSYIEEYLR